MSEQDDFLIEQLRSYGISLEDLEGLIRHKDQLRPIDESRESREEEPPSPAETSPPTGAFDSLIDSTPTQSIGAFENIEHLDADEPANPDDTSSAFEADHARELAIAEAKEAATEIRASAVKLVSEKLQAAEDEVMAMRGKAAEEVANLRKETSRAMVARLQSAEREAELLRREARDEQQLFWESAYREFSTAKDRLSQLRAQLGDLVSDLTEAVSSVEVATTSMVDLCVRHLRQTEEQSNTSSHGDADTTG